MDLLREHYSEKTVLCPNCYTLSLKKFFIATGQNKSVVICCFMDCVHLKIDIINRKKVTALLITYYCLYIDSQ